MFGDKKLFQRVESLERSVQEIALNQAALAEQLRSKGNVDAELRGQINVVAHDTAQLMGAVDKVVSLIGEPEPVTSDQAAERVENILSPFEGDNTAVSDETQAAAE